MQLHSHPCQQRLICIQDFTFCQAWRRCLTLFQEAGRFTPSTDKMFFTMCTMTLMETTEYSRPLVIRGPLLSQPVMEIAANVYWVVRLGCCVCSLQNMYTARDLLFFLMIIFKIYFIYLVCVVPRRTEAFNPLDLELQVVVSCPTQMLETELKFSTRAVQALNH